MSIREETLKIEDITLSPLAAHCSQTKGRAVPEEECSIRTAYQRDRDRIIHSSSFRRLKHKTQVFLSPAGDHYRTRLTHTFEVSQIARTIARALRLNEDLTEAIALAHDLGHTPFGHAGERALNEVFFEGFKHYEQSLRVVDVLEKDGEGLNLTYEVRDGILCHTTGKAAETLEGRIVKFADRIAYINHDIDDAIRAGILTEEDIPIHLRDVLGKNKTIRINTMVTSIIENSERDIKMAPEIYEAYVEIHKFMFENVYNNPVCKGEEGKAIAIVQELYKYYVEHPDEMPKLYREVAEKESPKRGACDYISGMSDDFALATYSRLFIPKCWVERGN
ncbi:MAG: deoxyguanosinetriphosphate triphosphohydrolase [Ruminococcaceae bacterium]|nr:deoxyguanosinetriphosphate triphosphohydrolase [Oscillospiraceae bacterium]